MSNPKGASVRRPRVTSRNSDLDNPDSAAAARNASWRTLNVLANLPRTPSRRASSAGIPSSRRSHQRTPIAKTPASGHMGSAKRTIAITPHGRAAQRELDLRRAGLTPGKDRRKSGRQQRETPRDTLRALSRILGPKSELIVPTPLGESGRDSGDTQPIRDDWEDDPDIERPRLSLPFDEDDEDDSLLLPPQSAGLEDEDITIQSVELGRRAHSERPVDKFSRTSFGDSRMSDAFADLYDFGSGSMADGFDSSNIAGNTPGEGRALSDDDLHSQRENTGVLGGLGLDRVRVSGTSGRASDIQPEAVSDSEDDTETSFVFNIPDLGPSLNDLQPQHNSELSMGNSEANFDANLNYGEDDETHQAHVDSPVAWWDIRPQSEPSTSEHGVDRVTHNGLGERRGARKRNVMISKHGIKYSLLQPGVVKRLAGTYARLAGNKARINKDALDAIMQASDWYFEQVSNDLSTYSHHAGRKTIDESDIITLMTRQRQISASTTPFSLAHKHLPRELLQEFRMVPPLRNSKSRLRTVDGGEGQGEV